MKSKRNHDVALRELLSANRDTDRAARAIRATLERIARPCAPHRRYDSSQRTIGELLGAITASDQKALALKGLRKIRARLQAVEAEMESIQDAAERLSVEYDDERELEDEDYDAEDEE